MKKYYNGEIRREVNDEDIDEELVDDESVDIENIDDDRENN